MCDGATFLLFVLAGSSAAFYALKSNFSKPRGAEVGTGARQSCGRTDDLPFDRARAESVYSAARSA